VQATVTIPAITLPHPGGSSQPLTLAWGSQADVRAVRRGIPGELDDRKVAAYVAKYAVKGTEQIGGIPVRIKAISDLDDWHVTGHVRKLITTCWQLSHRDDYKNLRLVRWAHQLGYSGWFSTRSRRYSVTLSSRRDERRHTRTAWIRQQRGLPAETGLITSEWHYAGTRQPTPISASGPPSQDQRLNFSISVSRPLRAGRPFGVIAVSVKHDVSLQFSK